MLLSRLVLAHRGRAGVVAAALAVSMLVVFGYTSGWAAAVHSSITGHFSSTVVPAPACTSPVGVCTEGTLTGGVKGTFSFTGTSLIQTADTPTTSVLLYTGDIIVRTKDGQFTCKDAGAFRTTGDGAVSSVCTIVGGTGAYAGVSGTLQFVGSFSSTGGGIGDYSGSLVYTAGSFFEISCGGSHARNEGVNPSHHDPASTAVEK